MVRKLDDFMTRRSSWQITLENFVLRLPGSGVRVMESSWCIPHRITRKETRLARECSMKAILATLCMDQPSKWPHYLKQCQRVINNAVHETTGEQPYYLMFHRTAPRRVTAALSTLDQDANVEVPLATVRTNGEQSRKYLERANIRKENK